MHTIDDIDVAGKTVLLRADFNVPLATVNGEQVITDDGRIRAALPTLQALVARGARVIVVAHLGRPKGEAKPELSLRPVATRLGELLDAPVSFDDVDGLAVGGVTVLENIRFDARETSKDVAQRQALAAELAALADVYVSDGFGVVHREQASVTDVARLLPHAAGYLVGREAQVFAKVLSQPERPYAVVLGGSKVSDKLGVIGNLLKVVDRLLIGGGMAFTFLAAQGFSVGDSLLESDQIETVKGFISDALARGVELVLPIDVVVADDFSANANVKVVAADAIPDGWKGLDIGPESTKLFASRLADAATIVWNGPMGVFEMAPFAHGTRGVAEAIERSDSMSVVGGGDSAAAIRVLGLDESKFSHISTGGGASLEYLEGKTLPGLAVLEERS